MSVVLRVVRGDPTAEELAIVTALASAAGGDLGEAAQRVQRGAWNDPAAQLRRQLYPGPGGWRASARPQ